jgi:hypothetical protein
MNERFSRQSAWVSMRVPALWRPGVGTVNAAARRMSATRMPVVRRLVRQDVVTA